MERETTKFDDWPVELGPHLTGVEVPKIQTFICSYRRYFPFILQDLEGYRRKSILIQLKNNHLIIWTPYRLSVSERIGVQACC